MYADKARLIIEEVKRAVIGKDDCVYKLMMAVLAGDMFCWRIFRVWGRRRWLWHLQKRAG